MTERLIEPGMLLSPVERELRERLDEPRLDDDRPRPLVDEERRLVDDVPFDDELAIVLDPNSSLDIVIVPRRTGYSLARSR
jgi:hypothetical protein